MKNESAGLWDAFRAGDYEAFRDIYEQYFEELFAYGLKVCHKSEQVEDAIQDLFLDLWKYKSSLSPTTSVKFYLFGSLRRKIYKNQSRVVMVSDEQIPFKKELNETSNAESRIIQEEEASMMKEQLLKSLKKLSDRQYDALILRFFGNFSYEEMAKLMGVNVQSARNLVQRGLQKIGSTMTAFLVPIIGLINYFLDK